MAKTILVVDDETEILKFVEMRLKACGYGVLLAEDGERALEVAKMLRPDLIILDIKIPKRDGYEVFHCLREDSATQGIPVIFASADLRYHAHHCSEEWVLADYVLKPYAWEELAIKIERYLKPSSSPQR